MIIEAEYQNGHIRWLQPVRFVHDHFRVRIEVPGEEVLADATQTPAPGVEGDLTGAAAELQRLTDALFGGDYCYTAQESDEEILAKTLSDKYV